MEAYFVIGVLVAFALLAWWAKNQGREVQEALDKLASVEKDAEIKETSREVSEVADSRRAPGLHDVPDVVPDASIPDWLKRR